MTGAGNSGQNTHDVPRRGSQRAIGFWVALAAGEVLIAAAVVIFRVFVVPTLALVALAAASLLIRRKLPSSLGYRRLAHPWRSSAQLLGLTVGWSVIQLGLFLPVLEHASGQKQDVSDFTDLQGNVSELLVLLALSWVYAALAEEFAFRAYLPTRITDVVGSGAVGIWIAVLISSALFGLLHTQQGIVGVLATFLDGIFFCVLRLRYRTVWAPTLAHGFNNTIGMVAFFFVGPISGLW